MKSVKVLKILAPIFTFILPLIITFLSYAQQTVTSGTVVSFVGLLVMGAIVISAIRSVKKNIKMRHEMNKKPNTLQIFFAYKFPNLAIYGAVVWFMWVIRKSADKLCIVLSSVGGFVVIGFVLSLVAQILEDKAERAEIR